MYDYRKFFLISKLPEPLSSDNLVYLIKQARMGETSARDKIVLHNIRLVINIVLSRFNKTDYDSEELVAVGLVGLVIAIDTFNVELNKAFSSYAGKCIENEIRMFIRKKRVKEESLDEVVIVNNDGDELRRFDRVASEYFDVVSEYEKKEVGMVIRNVVEQLCGRDREIIKLYFGFYDDRQYSQNEIALMMGMTRSNVSRIMKYSLQMLGEKLIECNILDGNFNVRSWVYNSRNKNDDAFEDVSLLKTIYGYFHGYSSYQVDNVLSKLDEEEINLLVLRYGDNFDDLSCGNRMSMNDLDKLYGMVIPKIRRLLNENDIVSKKRNLIIN